MKLTFVYTEISPNRKRHYNFALGALSAALKQAGHSTSLLHFTRPVTEQELIRGVSAEDPDIVGFTSTTHMFRHVREMARWVRKRSAIPIICGGVHASLDPEAVLAEPSIDMVCVGEGDLALVELCDAYERGETDAAIANIWRATAGRVSIADQRPLIEDLDTLPFFDREVFDYAGLEESKNRCAKMMVSRGCPYSCTYCCNHRLRELAPNGRRCYVRFRSVERVIEEIEELRARYDFVEFLMFHDDILPLNRRWIRRFSAEYGRHIGLPFRCNCRPDLMDEEVAQLLAAAGCVKVNFGIESGNDRIRADVLNRAISRDRIEQAFDACRSVGITTQSYNMVGIPLETPEAVLDTIRLNARVRPDVLYRTTFYPYPRTRLHELCRDRDMLTAREYDTFFEGTVLSQASITEGQVNFANQFFYPLVKLYRLFDHLPLLLSQLADRTITTVFSRSLIPLGGIAKAKMATMNMVRQYGLDRLQRHLPRLYLLLRSRKESRVQIYED